MLNEKDVQKLSQIIQMISSLEYLDNSRNEVLVDLLRDQAKEILNKK